MSIKEKTIGPLIFRNGKWRVPTNYYCYLCGTALREHFNIPKAAIQLWVTLTKKQPKHCDAIRVRFHGGRHVHLDGDSIGHHIMSEMRAKAKDFGSDFYATIYCK